MQMEGSAAVDAKLTAKLLPLDIFKVQSFSYWKEICIFAASPPVVLESIDPPTRSGKASEASGTVHKRKASTQGIRGAYARLVFKAFPSVCQTLRYCLISTLHRHVAYLSAAKCEVFSIKVF